MTNPESRPEQRPELPPETAPESLPETFVPSAPDTLDTPEAAAETTAGESTDGSGAVADEVPATVAGPVDAAPVAPVKERRLPIYRDFNLLQLAAIVFLIDQLTKFLVRAYLPFGYSFPFDGFFRITHTHNTGSAFGILQGQNTPLIFVSFIGIFVLALIYRSQARPTNLLRLSLGLQIGGALGNLLDRLRLGSVTDFIDVGPWPVFNLADASIVSGLVLLGWLLLRPSGKDQGGDNERVNAPATGAVAYAELPRSSDDVATAPPADDVQPLDLDEDYPGTAGRDCSSRKDGPG